MEENSVIRPELENIQEEKLENSLRPQTFEEYLGQNKVKESFEKGDIILLDRYTTSSLIYQSALIEDEEEKKNFIDFVIDFEYNKLGIKKPDKVIFLSASFELINEMRRKRKDEEGEAVEGDIHENNLEFLKKVYESAIFVAKYLNWDIVDCSDGDKMKSPEEIHEEIMKLVL